MATTLSVGCEGIVYNSRCIRPQEQTGITKAEAEFRCKSFGGSISV